MHASTEVQNVTSLNEPRIKRAQELIAFLELHELRAAERRRIAPRVLSRTACGWCGSTSGLRQTVDHRTIAPAMICVDDGGCLRRMREARVAA